MLVEPQSSIIQLYPPFLTASGVDRFLTCPGSATLLRVRGDDSAAALAGTEQHAVKLQRGTLPKKVLDWFGDEPAYELAMAADMAAEGPSAASVRVLGTYLQRGYPDFPGSLWLAGTADMASIVGTVVSVGDLKTGRGQASGSLPRPEDAGQLLALAWLTTVCRQAVDATFRPTRIRLMWWITADRPDDVEDAEISYSTLLDWVSTLRSRATAALANGARQLRRGAHCAGCSAFDVCPAQAGAVKRALEVSGRRSLATMTDADWAAAAVDIAAAERVLATAKQALHLRVMDHGPLVVDDEHELRLVSAAQPRYDVNVAAEVLGDRFGDCASVSVSAASIRRGLGTEDVGKVLEAIEAAGGVTRVPSTPYLRMVKRKKGKR